MRNSDFYVNEDCDNLPSREIDTVVPYQPLQFEAMGDSFIQADQKLRTIERKESKLPDFPLLLKLSALYPTPLDVAVELVLSLVVRRVFDLIR